MHDRPTYEFIAPFNPSMWHHAGLCARALHQVLPGGDLKLTPAGNRIVYKSRFEYTFGRDH